VQTFHKPLQKMTFNLAMREKAIITLLAPV